MNNDIKVVFLTQNNSLMYQTVTHVTLWGLIENAWVFYFIIYIYFPNFFVLTIFFF
jgi:hypothetical protein